jgi:hypothetical protein
VRLPLLRVLGGSRRHSARGLRAPLSSQARAVLGRARRGLSLYRRSESRTRSAPPPGARAPPPRALARRERDSSMDSRRSVGRVLGPEEDLAEIELAAGAGTRRGAPGPLRRRIDSRQRANGGMIGAAPESRQPRRTAIPARGRQLRNLCGRRTSHLQRLTAADRVVRLSQSIQPAEHL